MPENLIVSMPHCGTRFLRERLGVKHHVHTTADFNSLMKRIGKTQGGKLYTPLRHPTDVLRSWCRRHNARTFPYAEFFVGWGVLQHLYATMDLDVICVDKQEDERITDWSKVGDEDGSKAGWTLLKLDMRPLWRLPIITEHYGDSTGSN